MEGKSSGSNSNVSTSGQRNALPLTVSSNSRAIYRMHRPYAFDGADGYKIQRLADYYASLKNPPVVVFSPKGMPYLGITGEVPSIHPSSLEYSLS